MLACSSGIIVQSQKPHYPTSLNHSILSFIQKSHALVSSDHKILLYLLLYHECYTLSNELKATSIEWGRQNIFARSCSFYNQEQAGSKFFLSHIIVIVTLLILVILHSY